MSNSDNITKFFIYFIGILLLLIFLYCIGKWFNKRCEKPSYQDKSNNTQSNKNKNLV